MFRRLRIRRAHARFLESCRNLSQGRDYWNSAGPVRRWILETLIPVPLLGLHEDGKLLLQALEWLEGNCGVEPLRESTIKHYHKRVSGPDGAGGEYRTIRVVVVGTSVPRAAPERIPALMKALALKLEEDQRKLDSNPGDRAGVMRLALETYYRIGAVHPFADGNGRVARLALNHVLRRYAMGYVLFPSLDEAGALWEALGEAGKGNWEPLTRVAEKYTVRV